LLWVEDSTENSLLIKSFQDYLEKKSFAFLARFNTPIRNGLAVAALVVTAPPGIVLALIAWQYGGMCLQIRLFLSSLAHSVKWVYKHQREIEGNETIEFNMNYIKFHSFANAVRDFNVGEKGEKGEVKSDRQIALRLIQMCKAGYFVPLSALIKNYNDPDVKGSIRATPIFKELYSLYKDDIALNIEHILITLSSQKELTIEGIDSRASALYKLTTMNIPPVDDIQTTRRLRKSLRDSSK
jgi:hypothetical protein